MNDCGERLTWRTIAAPRVRSRGLWQPPLYQKAHPRRHADGDGDFAAAHLHVKMPTYPLQLTCLGVIYGTPALAAVFVALRIYTRRKLNLRLSWGAYCLPSCIAILTDITDDWLIIVPTILSLALIGPSHRSQQMNEQRISAVLIVFRC